MNEKKSLFETACTFHTFYFFMIMIFLSASSFFAQLWSQPNFSLIHNKYFFFVKFVYTRGTNVIRLLNCWLCVSHSTTKELHTQHNTTHHKHSLSIRQLNDDYRISFLFAFDFFFLLATSIQHKIDALLCIFYTNTLNQSISHPFWNFSFFIFFNWFFFEIHIIKFELLP